MLRAVWVGLGILLFSGSAWGGSPFPWAPAVAHATWLNGHSGLRVVIDGPGGEWVLTVLDEKEFAARVEVRSSDGSHRVVGPFQQVSTPEFFGAFVLLEHSYYQPNRGGFHRPVSVKKCAEITNGFSIPAGKVQTREWEFWLIQWHMGGCGLAYELNPSLLLGIHRQSKAWSLVGAYGQRFLDISVPEEGAACFDFLSSNRTKNNCWEIESWKFDFDGMRVVFSKGPPRFKWYGSELIANSSREARHWAHQEVAWNIASVTPQGGRAQAFASSPRDKFYFQGILPEKRSITFLWRSLVVASAKDGTRRFLSTEEAVSLAAKGGWDVVLERRNGQPTATWLVEHDKDFTHSTPPK